MVFLPEIAVALATLALICALGAWLRASESFQSSKLTRELQEVTLELVNLRDLYESVFRMVKRINGRDAMRKHRAKKNGASEMTDEEWRAHATKRIGQGLPVD